MMDMKKWWGILLCIDMKECDLDLITNEAHIKQFAKDLAEHIGMKTYGEPQAVHFGEDEKVCGYSLTQLIETSLISGHFVNGTRSAYIDVFSCKFFDPNKCADFARAYFDAQKIKIQVILRE